MLFSALETIKIRQKFKSNNLSRVRPFFRLFLLYYVRDFVIVNVLFVEKIGTVSPVRADWQVRQRLFEHLWNPFFLFEECNFELTRISLRFLGRHQKTGKTSHFV